MFRHSGKLFESLDDLTVTNRARWQVRESPEEPCLKVPATEGFRGSPFQVHHAAQNGPPRAAGLM